MGQSLTHLLVHAIFSTKDRRPFLRSEEIRNEIYAYMAGTLKNLDCHPIKIGGIEDHVHVFSSLSKNIAFAGLIGRLKGASSKRLKEKGSMALGGRMDTVLEHREWSIDTTSGLCRTGEHFPSLFQDLCHPGQPIRFFRSQSSLRQPPVKRPARNTERPGKFALGHCKLSCYSPEDID